MEGSVHSQSLFDFGRLGLAAVGWLRLGVS